ncbi:MAG: polysaccharide deacetylase family protein [Casimicrobiaceae bacterium]
MAIAVLAYHSQDIGGNDYHVNDHVALEEDVRRIAASGLPVVSAVSVASAIAARSPLPERAVVLTCDDGAMLDFADCEVPGHGVQKGFYRIVRESGIAPRAGRMTSFVIADPKARATLERTCLDGAQWLGEDWWPRAIVDGSWHLGVHSWDHHHPTLARYAGLPPAVAEFRGVDSYAEADRQVSVAARYLRARAANPGDRLFAYPYGNWTDYLAGDYFPHHADEHGMIAAFTTEPEFVHAGSNRWRLPRFVCRLHWRSPEELAAILRRL